MTDRSKQHPDDATVATWVRDLPGVRPDPAFRERLRSEFVSGRIDDAAVVPAPRRRPASPQRRWWGWAAPALVAAAAVFTLVVANRGPSLGVLGVSGTGIVHVDGRALDIADAGALDAAVRAGAVIEVPAGATVDLVVNGTALYELAGGTRMTLPESPGRWFRRAVACSMTVGELRLKTGPGFAGSELSVHTPEGVAVVTGTLLSVQCDAGGTCVCVLEGVARVGVDATDLDPVAPGYRKIMLRDGTVDIIPNLPVHRDGVLDFDRRVGDRVR